MRALPCVCLSRLSRYVCGDFARSSTCSFVPLFVRSFIRLLIRSLACLVCSVGFVLGRFVCVGQLFLINLLSVRLQQVQQFVVQIRRTLTACCDLFVLRVMV